MEEKYLNLVETQTPDSCYLIPFTPYPLSVAVRRCVYFAVLEFLQGFRAGFFEVFVNMAASCFSMETTQVLPSLEATAVTALGGGLACLKAPCSRIPMMALPMTVPCHSGISHAHHGISCLTPVLGRRRVLRIRSLAQDSPVAAEVVEEAQDIPLV